MLRPVYPKGNGAHVNKPNFWTNAIICHQYSNSIRHQQTRVWKGFIQSSLESEILSTSHSGKKIEGSLLVNCQLDLYSYVWCWLAVREILDSRLKGMKPLQWKSWNIVQSTLIACLPPINSSYFLLVRKISGETRTDILLGMDFWQDEKNVRGWRSQINIFWFRRWSQCLHKYNPSQIPTSLWKWENKKWQKTGWKYSDFPYYVCIMLNLQSMLECENMMRACV